LIPFALFLFSAAELRKLIMRKIEGKSLP
jgi:hypothetical protein